MPDVQKKPPNLAIDNDPKSEPQKGQTTFVQFVTNRIGPASFPKWIIRFLILKVVADLVRYGFMHKADAARVKNGDFTPKRSLFRSASRMPASDYVVVDDDSRDTVFRLMDFVLPHDKAPAKGDFKALVSLAERHGIGEEVVHAVLVDTLDNQTLHALGLTVD